MPTHQPIDLIPLDWIINRSPLTVTAKMLVIDAIALLNEAQADCVLVVENQQLLGIFTAQDVVKLVAARKDLASLKMFEVMTKQVITLTPSHSQNAIAAFALMTQHRLRHLPIVDERDRLLGLVTQDSAIFPQSGRYFDALTIAADIAKQQAVLHEYQHTEAILQESEQRFHTMADTVPVLIWLAGTDKLCNYFNQTWLEFTGRTLEQEIGHGWIEGVHRDDSQHCLDTYFTAFDTHQPFTIEYRLRRFDGEYRWLLDTGNPRFNSDDSFAGYIGSCIDISEVKHAEEALKESKQQYVTLAQAVPVGIFRTNLEGHCLYVNERWCQLTGLSQVEARKDGWAQALHPGDRQRVFEEWYQSAQQNIPFKSEYRFQRADGVTTWVFGQAVNERGIDDEIIGYVGTITDISEVKRAEETLRHYERIVSAMPDGVALVNRNYTFRLINQSYLSLHKKSYYDIIGHTLGELLGEDTFTRPIKPFLDRSLAGETIRYEDWFNYAKAGRRFVGVTYAPYVDTDGTISGVVINTRDLTELKHAQQKIVEQAMLLDVATDAIFVRGLDSQILFWNNGATSIYGWSAQEAIGKNAKELLYQKPAPQLMQEALKTVVDTGSWQGELAKVNKLGQEIVVSSRWTLVRDEEGKPKSILTVDTDITEQKKLAAQFLRAQRLESIGTLAGGIAHDLNNVLAPILMSVQLLQLKYPEDQNRQLLNLLENNVKRGAALVKQVLSFARGIEGDRTIVQVKHLILEIANIIKETFPKSIELSINIASNLNTVLADATQLHQVLMNLVVNARDAMPNGGSLSISAANIAIDKIYAQKHIEAKVRSYIVVTVTDTGTGIPPDIMERIFDPFFTTKEIGKGTGLGLSTTIGIIKSHKGFVEVSSEVGKSSTFKMYLPAREETVTQQPKTPELLTGNGGLVLVVDDEAAICEITKTALESSNYRVLTANNGIEALALYAQNKNEIRAVLLDMMMPKMDGLTTILTLQKMNPSILIIATSGLTSINRINLAMGTGVQAFLPKPYTAQELLNTLQEILSAKEEKI